MECGVGAVGVVDGVALAAFQMLSSSSEAVPGLISETSYRNVSQRIFEGVVPDCVSYSYRIVS